MIAKRITSKASSSHFARLAKYVVAAKGGIDPRSWSRTADYIIDSGISSKGEKVGGVRVTNCNTNDPAAATTLIEATQAVNTTSKTDKTYHLVFSFPPGENPDLKTLHKIEDELVASIGYADHQRISAVHIDTDHLHVHVAINKVHPTGFQNIEPYFDKLKLMETCERLEIELGLTRTNHGLTGERKHVRNKEIELSADYQFDGLHTLDSLYKSHVLALAAERERSNNNGMPELPGGDVAHIERGYSELLPGDARNRVLEQRNKRPEGLRWEGLGANGTRSKDSSGITRGLNAKAAEMEAHSGVETLNTYIKRDVAQAMHGAANWQELHNLLSVHGLQIKKRGAGLVIGSGELWVKASQVDREFSIKALTDKLGPFEKAQEKPAKEYQPKPKHQHPSSAKLFEIYERGKNARKASRRSGMAVLNKQYVTQERNLNNWKIAKRLMIKATLKGPERRVALKVVKLQAMLDQQKIWGDFHKSRLRLLADTKSSSWVEWLEQQAGWGNIHALDVLRSREEHSDVALHGNANRDYLTAKEPGGNLLISELRPFVDSSGSVFYNTEDGGRVIDRKTHVQAFKATKGATQLALEIAAERFKGQALIVEGTDSFKAEVVRLAKTYNVNVRFADPDLAKDAKARSIQKNKGVGL